ncbi:Transcriptional repressor tup12-related protein [Tritrichomonas foetus]|uniref:Transcriptional repressor tup12-related protein n=1 Tax=Tritrichomonas foetus TaxID=1144522 RepID=A0A1J4KUC6_9EUKA|nr:Transcriptional repressor tup12-related protein [Tritrichomonas foetus]|eukprot:OHT13364.1 Transcriptional repressor tup12-related protein [Tritrichomonas foetus]
MHSRELSLMSCEMAEPRKSDHIDQHLQTYTESICHLKQEIEALSMNKNKFLIYINQYEHDIQQIREILNHYSQILGHVSAQQDIEKVKNDNRSIANDNYSFIVNDDEVAQMTLTNLPYNIMPEIKFQNGFVSQRFAIKTNGVICSVQHDPSGENIAFSDGNMVNVISSKTGELQYSLDLPKSYSRNDPHTRIIRFSNNGLYIASSAMISAIAVYSTKSRKILGVLEGHQKTVSSFIFLKKSETLISGGYDGKLCFWDIIHLKLIKEIQHGENNTSSYNKSGAIVSISTDEDEKMVTVGFLNGSVGIYESSFTQPMNIFIAHSDFLMSLKIITKDLMILTTSQDKTVKLWTMKGIASCKNVLHEHSDIVLSSCIDNNQKFLITGSKDETIKGWKLATGELLFSLECQKNSIFDLDHHPTDKSFVSCSGDGTVIVWDYELPEL